MDKVICPVCGAEDSLYLETFNISYSQDILAVKDGELEYGEKEYDDFGSRERIECRKCLSIVIAEADPGCCESQLFELWETLDEKG